MAMNRYVLGGALALLMLVALSGVGGINQLFQGNSRLRGGLRADDSDLGTLPIEQAGQAVQRQGSASGGVPINGAPTNGVPMNPTTPSPSGDLAPTMDNGFTAPAGTPPAASPTPPGSPQNVIPRQGVTTLPAPWGDIAPVQPGLVRPDPVPPVIDDPELESIPALW